MPYETASSGADYGCAAVICTAVEVESESIEHIFGGTWSQLQVPGDEQHYFEAKFTDKHGMTQRVITCQQDMMGMSAASALAAKATMLFRPRYLIMCGIAAGIRSEVEQMYGDVLVPNVVWDYSTGKFVGPDESVISFGDVGFLPRPQPMYLDPDLMILFDRLSKPGACEFHVQTGPLACGTSVMANASMVDYTVRALNPATVGLDMESYSVFLAASHARDPKPKALVVKSICDYANANKDDRFQAFAAFTASRFVEYLLTSELEFGPQPVRQALEDIPERYRQILKDRSTILQTLRSAES